MKTLALLHRWTGGLVGLVLALLGLTGTILLFKDNWIALPYSGDAQRTDLASIAAATSHIMARPEKPQGIIYASENFGLHQARFGEEAGLYTDQAGEVIARWDSKWGRPEHWLFDLHHHLFAGDVGEWISGIAGLCALFFIVSGLILWWRTRRTFRFRWWPARMSRPAIIMHHRDLGLIVAPLLLLSVVTGTMMLFRPFAIAVVAPFGSVSAMVKALEPPKYQSGPLAETPDYPAMLGTARQLYPTAEFRILSLPKKPGDPISLRMRQQAEWLPNGRTTLWFDAATGQLLGTRDALKMPGGAQAFNMAYPLHAAKVGGIAYKSLMAVVGLALTLLGSLAVWSFWVKGGARLTRGGHQRATATAKAATT
jgi:uncharacterized iron-regulated membrane protein